MQMSSFSKLVKPMPRLDQRQVGELELLLIRSGKLFDTLETNSEEILLLRTERTMIDK